MSHAANSAAVEGRGTAAEVDDLLYESALAARIGRGLKLSVNVEARPPGGVYAERADELRQNLRELGIEENVEVEEEQE